ncbi:DUF2865 domain-containing protein [Rhizobium sp. KVB221]|uniref:DUF2865 domain-containing protein n=1 Tax=Rhizobium setariae TaxID=2801340 RepID=A0A936YTW7_9HYPH|nr:DUF2865 domain-containing protein [Rhizobium setariae]MBL0372747.1 DUF2865 domain-containing protein [Rhizobium setariae]
MPRILTSTALAMIAVSFFGSAAQASEVCDQLGFELANLSQSMDAVGEARKYARAIAEQRGSIRELDHAMRQAGCTNGSMIIIGGPNEPECSAFEAKKTRMERNLQILDAKRLSLLADNPSGLKRQRLVAALDDNRCNEQPVLVSTPDNGQPFESLVKDGPGGTETIRIPSTEPVYGEDQFIDLGGAAINGSYRTMCVRTCDGAYFPVSSHASTLNFRRDAQVCSMMCPGTETELFYHSIRSESDGMRSAMTGQSYVDLPNAYRFRTKGPDDDRQCGCDFALYYKEMMRREAVVKSPGEVPAEESSIVWVKPGLRGGLKHKTEMAAVKPAPVERDYNPGDKVRIIGPRFLPDDEGMDFMHPAGPSESEGQ